MNIKNINEATAETTITSIASYLKKKGAKYKELKLSSEVHTVEDVVNECKCKPDQIVKTMLYLGLNDIPILIAINGSKSIDVSLLENLIQQKIRLATPKQVKEITTFSVGTVSPFLINPLSESILLADASLLQNNMLFMGSGNKKTLITIKSLDFKKVFKGKFINLY